MAVTCAVAATGTADGAGPWDTPSITFTEGYKYLFVAYVVNKDDAAVSTITMGGAGLTWSAGTQQAADDAFPEWEGWRQFNASCSSTTAGVLSVTSSNGDGLIWACLEVREANSIRQQVSQAAIYSTSITPTLAALLNSSSMNIAAWTQSAQKAHTAESGFTELVSIPTTISGRNHQMDIGYKLNDTTATYTVATIDVLMGGAWEATATTAMTKSVAGSITPTGVGTYAKNILLSLAGAITAAGEVFMTKPQFFGGSITPTGALTTTRIRRFLTALSTGTKTLVARAAASLSLTERDSTSITMTEKAEGSLSLTELDSTSDTPVLTPFDEENA